MVAANTMCVLQHWYAHASEHKPAQRMLHAPGTLHMACWSIHGNCCIKRGETLSGNFTRATGYEFLNSRNSFPNSFFSRKIRNPTPRAARALFVCLFVVIYYLWPVYNGVDSVNNEEF